MISAETIATFVAAQTSPETRRAYGRDLRVFTDWLGDHLSRDLSDDEVIAFRDMLIERYAPAGAVRVWSTVRSLYRFARQSSAFEVIKGPKRIKNVVPRLPDDTEIDALVEASLAPDSLGRLNARRALVIPLLLNGLRASEVGDLLKTGIERHILNINGEPVSTTILRVVGKGRKERLVPATTEVEIALMRYQHLANTKQKRSEYAVTDIEGGHLNYRKVEHDVYRAAEMAGITCHPHALRHAYATRLIRAGVDSTYVQQLLGHDRLETTQRYVGLDLRDLVMAATKDPRNGLLTLRQAVG